MSIKFFVLGGVYDSMIDGARLLRTTLDEFSAPVTYLEVSEGHNTNTFRAHLDDALKALLPRVRVQGLEGLTGLICMIPIYG